MKKEKNKFLIIVTVGILVCFLILVIKIIETRNITVKRSKIPLITTQAIDIPNDINDPIIGNRGAAITLTIFIDFNDKKNFTTYKKIQNFILDNPNKIRMIIKDYPKKGIFNDDNLNPHLAIYCANKYNKSFEFIQKLLEKNKNNINLSELEKIAEDIGIIKSSWSSCINSTEAKLKVESSVSFARSIYLSKAPVIFLNNLRVNHLDEIDLNDLLKEVIK